MYNILFYFNLIIINIIYKNMRSKNLSPLKSSRNHSKLLNSDIIEIIQTPRLPPNK